MTRTVVVAAYPPELSAVPRSAWTESVGIGPIEAAAGMAALLAAARPDRVLLVGTCGAFSGTRLGAGELVVVERAVWAAGGAGVSVPEAVPRAQVADAELVAQVAQATGARLVTAVCRDGVTVDDDEAVTLHNATGAAVEHMECFAVFRACVREGVPAAALLAVANRVGNGARAEWKANHEAAEKAAGQAAGRFLGV